MDKDHTFKCHVGQHLCTVRILGYTWMHGAKPFTALGLFPLESHQGSGAMQELLIPIKLSKLTEGAAVLAIRNWSQDRQLLLKCCNSGCDNPAWNRKIFPSEHRDDRCEDCWVHGFQTGWNEIQRDRAAKDAREDAAAKAQGFKWKCVAWIHPAQGDDYMLIFHSEGPFLASAIEAALKQEGSTVLSDYQITAL